jgi:hypothetical protein
MLPQVKSAIQTGSHVEFNSLPLFEGKPLGKKLDRFAYASKGFSVDARGITSIDTGQAIPWENITDFGVTRQNMGRLPVEVLYIQSATARLLSRYGLLQNAHVLLALCAEMTGLNLQA